MEDIVQKRQNPDSDSSQGRLNSKLVLAVFASVIGCSFQFGFHTGVMNIPQNEEYKYGFEEQTSNSTEAKLSNTKVLFFWSLTVSIFGAGGLVAGFTGSYFATKLGRKRMMLANNFVLLVAVAFMVSAKFAKTLELMIVGRLIHGINCGFSTVVTPVYLNEISPVNLRGGVGTIHQLAVVSGILISQVLGLEEVFGTRNLYYLLFGFPLVCALLQLFTLPFCPESPSWLYITKKKPEKSRQSLQWFDRAFNVEQQLHNYQSEVNELQSRKEMSFGDMFKKFHLRRPLLIAVIMQFSQQFSGIIAVLNYSTSIFKSTGLAENHSQYATLGISGVMIIITVISVLFMDRAGRRVLHLTGLSGCLVSMIIVTVALFIQEQNDWAKYLSIVSLVIFIMSFAVGPGSIPWFITAELFDQTARPYATSIATFVNWSANFVSGLVFPIMQKELGYYCFIPYIALLLFFVLFTFFKVPETKNKSTEEVVALFQKHQYNIQRNDAADTAADTAEGQL